MKVFASEDIRNVGLFSHSGAGKTSLCEAFLFASGATNRLHSVDEENSNFDTEEEEKSRRISTSMHLGYAVWNKAKINFIDTPGDLNFQADVRYAMEAVDVGMVLVSAVDGVEVGTEKTFNLLTKCGLPRTIVINKMDREHANFDKTLADIQSSLDIRPTVLMLPIGDAATFQGVVDVVKQKAYIFEDQGTTKFKVTDVPADLADRVETLHTELVENVAESDEELMEKFFEGELTESELQAGLRAGIAAGEITPVTCGSATKLVGVAQLMDFITETLPSPLEADAVSAKNQAGEAEEIKPDNDGALAAFVFKTFVDPFAGKITCTRIRRGVLPGAGEFLVSNHSGKERYSVLHVIQGKKQDPIAQANAGDIVIFSKLKETSTGHSIGSGRDGVQFDMPDLPAAAISFAVSPKTQSDEEKLGPSLHRLMEEDPCVRFERDEITHEFLLSGLGQAHVESVVGRLKSRFNVEVDLQTPKVPYKETIRSSAKARGRHKKQSGGRGQFGDCWVEFSPRTRGEGYEYVDKVVGGSIPRQFIPAVDKGIQDAMKRGYLAGFPMVDVEATCYDGSYHAVDSSDMAFQIAGSLAFKEAMPNCSAVILEPVMKLEIVIPDDCMGDVIGDLNGRRGRVLGMVPKGKNQEVGAMVPMAEVLTYASDLKSITSARGNFTMEFDHYEEMPPQLQEKVVAEVMAAREADN
tara:strand:- start:822 stop:2906 length:2085 start_codon:yes stop_codon:yes gene_type:complete